MAPKYDGLKNTSKFADNLNALTPWAIAASEFGDDNFSDNEANLSDMDTSDDDLFESSSPPFVSPPQSPNAEEWRFYFTPSPPQLHSQSAVQSPPLPQQYSSTPRVEYDGENLPTFVYNEVNDNAPLLSSLLEFGTTPPAPYAEPVYPQPPHIPESPYATTLLVPPQLPTYAASPVPPPMPACLAMLHMYRCSGQLLPPMLPPCLRIEFCSYHQHYHLACSLTHL